MHSKSDQLHACCLRLIKGSAQDCTERAGAVGQSARADEHESDDASVQQPHDVLSDHHEAPAGCKPKTRR